MSFAHNNGLVGLRVLATLLVALFHFELYYPLAGIKIFNGSYLCVEFFFVLSGFLLARKYFHSTETGSFKNFLKNRLVRLYPAYLFSLLVLPTVYAVTWFGGSYLRWLKDGTHLPAFLSEIFMLQTTGIAGFEFINGPAWYVSALVLCSCFLFCLHKSIKVQKWYFWGAISLTCYSVMMYCSCPEMSPAPWGLIRGMAGMTLGIFLEHVHMQYKGHIASFSLTTINFVEILAFLFFMRMLLVRTHAVYNLFILIPIAILILSMLSQNRSFLSRALGSSRLFYLECISYQFYVVQSFCSNIFTCILKNVSGVTAYVYYVVLNILVAIFIYEVIEKKFIPWFINKNKRIIQL